MARCVGTSWEKGKHWELKARDTWIYKARRNRKHDKSSWVVTTSAFIVGFTLYIWG